MATRNDITCQLLVIGSGMAGMAASLFAALRGIDTIQVGPAGTLPFASGMLDFLGVHPVHTGRLLPNPWDGITQLRQDEPDHPYAVINDRDMRTAWKLVLANLTDAGLPYTAHPDRNMRMISPVGTDKLTYAVPHTMMAADEARRCRPPCLLVDFPGLKGFSARQIAANMQSRWPALRTARLSIPALKGELQPERLARFLENADPCRELADAIKSRLADAQAVGLPAVVGLHRAARLFDLMQERIGVPLFEIPTLLPSVPGRRLRDAFIRQLSRLGVRTWYQHAVQKAQTRLGDALRFRIGNATDGFWIQSRAAILATGRFLGRGLHAERTIIRENLFDLPVHQPGKREQWHHKDLLHPEGHAINRAGLMVDARFRPVDQDGLPRHLRLFAAGSILAHQDWVRQKCGSGLAITSAYAAVAACAKLARDREGALSP
jgi:glycerol-3-phosphate dehydrogenase subunit B